MPTTRILLARGQVKPTHCSRGCSRLDRCTQCCERTAPHHGTRERVPDDIFGEARRGDQLGEIDPGLYPHLITHENEVFGTNVTSRALVTGERTSAKSSDGRIK